MFHCSLQVLCFTGVFGLIIIQAASLKDTGQILTTEIRYSQNNSEPIDQASSTNAATPSTHHIHAAGTFKDKDDVTEGIKHQPQLKLFTLPPKTTSIPLIRRNDPSIKVFTSIKNSTSMATSTPSTNYDFTEMSVQASVHEAHSISSYNISELDAGQNVTSPPTYDSPDLLPLQESLDDESINNTIPSEPASEPEPSNDIISDDENIPELVTSLPTSEPEPSPVINSDNKETNDSLSLDNYTSGILDSSYSKTTTPSNINLTASNGAANNSETNIADINSTKPFSLHALLKSNLYYGTIKPIHKTSKPKIIHMVTTIKPFYTAFSLDPQFFQATTPLYEFDNSTKHSNTPKPKIADETANFLKTEKIQVIVDEENTVLNTHKSFKNKTSTEISNASIIFDSEFAESSQDQIIFDSEFAESSYNPIRVIPNYVNTNQTNTNTPYFKELEYKRFHPLKKLSQPSLPETYLTKSSHADNYSNKYNSNYYNKESNSLYNGASFDPISLQIRPASPSYKSYGNTHASNKYVNRPAVNDKKATKSHKYDPGHHVNEYKSRPFSFEYQVKDKHMGTDFSHREKSDGRVTAGRYSVLLPDGRRQVVSFTADHLLQGGYQATVEYEKYTPKYKDMVITTNKSVEIHSYKDTSSTSLNEVDSFDYKKQVQENKNEVTPTLPPAPAPVSTYAPAPRPTSEYISYTTYEAVPTYASTPIPTPEPTPSMTSKAVLTNPPEPVPTSEPIPSTTYTSKPEPIFAPATYTTSKPEPIYAPAPVATYAPAPRTPLDLSLYPASVGTYAPAPITSDLSHPPASVVTYAPAFIAPPDLSFQNNSTKEHATTRTQPTYHRTTYFSLSPDDTYVSTKNNDSQFIEDESNAPYHINHPPVTQKAFTGFGLSSRQRFYNEYGSDISSTESSKIWDVMPYRIVGNIGWDEVFKT